MSPINPKYDAWFCQIYKDLQKFKTCKTCVLNWTIGVNLRKSEKNSLCILGLIGDKLCWSDKEQPEWW